MLTRCLIFAVLCFIPVSGRIRPLAKILFSVDKTNQIKADFGYFWNPPSKCRIRVLYIYAHAFMSSVAVFTLETISDLSKVIGAINNSMRCNIEW